MVQLLKEGHIHLCRQRVDKDLLHIGRMRSYDLSRAQRNDKGGAVCASWETLASFCGTQMPQGLAWDSARVAKLLLVMSSHE